MVRLRRRAARFYVLDSAWGDTNLGTADPYANDAAAHFVPGTPEYEWLRNDLQAHPSGLKFAVSHYPLYSDDKSSRRTPSCTDPRTSRGSSPNTAWTCCSTGTPTSTSATSPSAPGAPVTYVTGGGGAKLAPIGPCHPFDAYGHRLVDTATSKGSRCGSAPVPTAKSQVFHFLKVTVSGTTVTVTPTDASATPSTSRPTASGARIRPRRCTTGLTATPVNPTTVNLAWNASTDAVGVTAYDITRNGEPLTTVAGTATTFSDSTAAASSTYGYAVRVRDGAGNASAYSPTVSATTPGTTAPVFSNGFESGNLSVWTSSAGLTVQTAVKHSGSFAARGNTTNGIRSPRRRSVDLWRRVLVLCNVQPAEHIEPGPTCSAIAPRRTARSRTSS